LSVNLWENAGQTIVVSSNTSSLNLTAGTIHGGTVAVGNGVSLIVSGNPVLDGVTVNGVLDVGNSYNGATLTVTNGLVLNGTALVGSATNGNYATYGAISFAGNQVLGGNGTVVFGSSYGVYCNCACNALLLPNAGTTLVIGPGITVRGQYGQIGYSTCLGGPGNVGVVNQGTISADSGGTITVSAQPFSNQGVVESPAGALSVNLWENAGQTIVVSSNTSSLNLTAGTIHGGTVAVGNGVSLIVSGNPVLDGVTVNGVLDVGNSYNGATLTVTNGLVLNGTLLVGNPTNSDYGSISFVGNQVLSGNGTVVFGGSNPWGTGSANALFLANGGTTLVIGPGITVRGQNGTIGAAGSPWGSPANVSVVNQGTISADMSGGRITINAQPFSNQGLVESPLGSLSVNLWENAGQTIVVSSNTSSLNLTAGTIHGGTVAVGNGVSLIVSGNPVLDGVTVNGVLDVGNSYNGATLTVTNGLVLNGTLLVGNPTNSNYGSISFVGNQVLSGNGTVVFGGSNPWGTGSANALFLANGGTTLVIGPGITVRGQNGTIGATGSPWGSPANVSVVSQGTISADVSGGRITINAQPFSNQGLVESPLGTLNLGGTLAGLGNIQSGNGPLVLSGVLTNAGQTLVLEGATNTLTLQGGTILDGTIAPANGASCVVNSGTLDGVTVNGVLDVGNSYNGATLTVTNGLVLNGTALVGNPTNSDYGSISFVGNQVLSGNGTVVFGGSNPWGTGSANALFLANGGTTLVIGPGITVRGQNGTIGATGSPWGSPANVSVVNQGTISADVSGGTMVVTGTSFSNGGQLLQLVSGGTIMVTANTLNTGLIEVDHGAITFSSGFTQNVGTVDFGLSGPADFGQINLTGAASMGGTLSAQLDGRYLPDLGDSFAVLNYGTNSVAFTNVNLPTSAVWQTNYNHGVLTLVVEGILPLGVTISPSNQTVAAGSTVTFQATAGGPGPFGYQWLWNGVALAGATNSSLVLSNVTSAASGAYTVKVSNANGSVLSAAAELSVLGPPAITTEPQSQTVGVGTTVTFLVTATGAAPLSYQWSFDGQLLPGATNANLTLTNVIRVEAGSYSVVVSNAVGSATSAPPAVLSIATGVPCPGTPPGMVAWWRGEGNTGDYAGTNDAVFEGVAGYGPGEVGEAFLLDGVTSYLQAPNNPLWAIGTNDFTIEFWASFAEINPSLAAGDGSIVFVGQDEGPGAHNRWFFGFGGQELYFYFYGPSVGPHLVAPAPVNLVINQWYHLAVTKGSNVYRTYIDGSQVGVETNSLDVPVASAPLTIGQAQGLFTDGLLDEISLYNRALGASEVQAIYQAGAKGKCGLESESAIRLQAQMGADGKVTIRITGAQIGATLTVEATEDFKQWAPIGSVVASQDVQSFTDPTPVLPPERYYRVSQTLNP